MPAVPAPATRRVLRNALRLTLSHHPLCDRFPSDTWRIAGVAICIGCLTVWPSAAAGAWAAWNRLLPGEAWLQLGGALAAGVPYVALSACGTRSVWRHAAKPAAGLGLGVAAVAALRLGLPPAGLAALLAGASAAAILLLLLRGRRILATCRACPWRMDWEACPGMVAHDGRWRDPVARKAEEAPAAMDVASGPRSARMTLAPQTFK